MTLSDPLLFIKKAKEDIVVLEKLVADTEVSDASWGFHAQQALEKLLKSLLSRSQVLFSKSHDLNYLIDLIPKEYTDLVADVEEECSELNPFGVAGRCDDLIDCPLNRAVVLSKIKDLCGKVEVLN